MAYKVVPQKQSEDAVSLRDRRTALTLQTPRTTPTGVRSFTQEELLVTAWPNFLLVSRGKELQSLSEYVQSRANF